MSVVLADRVGESTLTTGTANLVLAGALVQYQSVATGIGVGNSTEYVLLSGNGTDWEVGLGTLTGASAFSRDTVKAGSSGVSKISLSGTSFLYITAPAASLQFLETGQLSLPKSNSFKTAFSRPAAASYTIYDSTGSSPTLTDTAGGPLTLLMPHATGGDGICMGGVSDTHLSNPTYTITQRIQANHLFHQFVCAGIALSDGTKFEGIGFWNNTGSQIGSITWSGIGTGAAFPANFNFPQDVYEPMWYRVAYNGANRVYSVSADGELFWDIWTGTLGSFTPTKVCFGFIDTRDNTTTSTPYNVHLWELLAV